jgi:hypothetical protein
MDVEVDAEPRKWELVDEKSGEDGDGAGEEDDECK